MEVRESVEPKCEIIDKETVVVTVSCRICEEKTTKEMPWEWASTATSEDYKQISICDGCFFEDVYGESSR